LTDTREHEVTSDPHCFVDVHINPELRVKVTRGRAPAVLVVGAWTPFLVKVRNEAGTTAVLRAASSHDWLEVRNVSLGLRGAELEYRILHLFARERGRLEATLSFDVGQGTQDLGFRSEVPVLFECRPPVDTSKLRRGGL
jgi:hypothetical protein